MSQRSDNTSKIVIGPPHTFGWVRCSALDTKGLEAWERPDGTGTLLPPSARLGRIRGSRGQPILLSQRAIKKKPKPLALGIDHQRHVPAQPIRHSPIRRKPRSNPPRFKAVCQRAVACALMRL